MKLDIDSLLIRLYGVQYTSSGGYRLPVIANDNRKAIENTVREWYNDQLLEQDASIEKLEAKVYAYEQIIAKSNFAPLLPEAPEAEGGNQ